MTGLENRRLRCVFERLSSKSGGISSENCLAKEPRQFLKSFSRFRRMDACKARLPEPHSLAENPVRNGVFNFTLQVTGLAGFSNSLFLTDIPTTHGLKFVPFPHSQIPTHPRL